MVISHLIYFLIATHQEYNVLKVELIVFLGLYCRCCSFARVHLQCWWKLMMPKCRPRGSIESLLSWNLKLRWGLGGWIIVSQSHSYATSAFHRWVMPWHSQSSYSSTLSLCGDCWMSMASSNLRNGRSFLLSPSLTRARHLRRAKRLHRGLKNCKRMSTLFSA